VAARPGKGLDGTVAAPSGGAGGYESFQELAQALRRLRLRLGRGGENRWDPESLSTDTSRLHEPGTSGERHIRCRPGARGRRCARARTARQVRSRPSDPGPAKSPRSPR
jgi:hypothetical protein